MKIYMTYMLPKLTYCSQLWNTGKEKHLRSIVKDMEKYWKLSLGKNPPEDYLWPKEQLIKNDLVLLHKISQNKLVLDEWSMSHFLKQARITPVKIQVKK